MKLAGHSLLKGLALCGVVIAYAIAAHYTSARVPHADHWAVLLAVAPLLLLGFDFARQSSSVLARWLLPVAGLGLLIWIWPLLQRNVSWMYFLQHVGVNGALALLFARTLVAGRKPLCTLFAEFVHPRMTPAVLRYTRQVTVAWALFFALTVLTSLILFAIAPVEAWSVFANILPLPMLALMFVAEHIVRTRVLPAEDQVGPLAAVQAFRLSMASRQQRCDAAAPNPQAAALPPEGDCGMAKGQ